MATRRCEICGRLHAEKHSSVSVQVVQPEVNWGTYEHYSTCSVCADQVHKVVEDLKVRTDTNVAVSINDKLVQRQDAELQRYGFGVRRAYDTLLSALKSNETSPKEELERIRNRVEAALEYLNPILPCE